MQNVMSGESPTQTTSKTEAGERFRAEGGMDGAKSREILEKNQVKSAKRLNMGKKFIF